MRVLLEFLLKYLDFLYLDPRYRITDSKTRGDNASLTITGPDLIWHVANDRGQMQLSITPTRLATARNGFWVSLIKQYVDGDEEIHYLSALDEIRWMRENGNRVEQLFSDASTIETTCEDLKVLRRANADKYWSRWREQQGLSEP
ncbi:MAG TPA: hypothetical protein VNY55_06760 [Mycobacterium sp.]|nr:hypothetical protein [Mycobacterium sp.]